MLEIKEYVIGWLDREGNHYSCKRYNHSETAVQLGHTETELDNRGWIKIFDDDCDCWYCCLSVSEQQAKWLFENGLLDEYDKTNFEKDGRL